MKILIFTAIQDDYKGSLGVIKKIKCQVKAWKKLKNEVFYCFEDKNHLKLFSSNGEIVDTINNNGKIRFRIDKYKALPNLVEKYRIDVLYVRYDTIDYLAFKAFYKCRMYGTKVIIEFPTYPYEGEIRNSNKRLIQNRQYAHYLIKRILQLSEKIALKKAKLCVDFFVTFMYEGTICDVPVVCIDNGVDVSGVPKRKKKSQAKLTYLCMANFAKWHGIDRLIAGISSDKIKDYQVWLVGEGSELQNLKNQVDEAKLENTVLFLGAKNGDELNEITRCADIGIGSLGLHRIGLTWGSTLKVKEYCASSLPFIYSYDEKKLTGNEEFAFKLPADDSPIDMALVSEWSRNVIMDGKLPSQMRHFAEENYDWTVIIKELIDKISQGRNV